MGLTQYLSEKWHRFGYRMQTRQYRKLWGEPGEFRYSGGVNAHKILVCMPPVDGPVFEAVKALKWMASQFKNSQFTIVLFEAVSGNVPIDIKSLMVLKREHFNWYGLPHKSFLEEVRAWQPDLAIDLSDPANEVTDLICATSGAKHHASLDSVGSRGFESTANILIAPSPGTSRTERYSVLLKYLAPKY